MKAELLAFVAGIVLRSLQHSLEAKLGQKLISYALQGLAKAPSVAHYVAGHIGPSVECNACKPNQIDTLSR